jgi:hypothetical protein
VQFVIGTEQLRREENRAAAPQRFEAKPPHKGHRRGRFGSEALPPWPMTHRVACVTIVTAVGSVIVVVLVESVVVVRDDALRSTRSKRSTRSMRTMRTMRSTHTDPTARTLAYPA